MFLDGERLCKAISWHGFGVDLANVDFLVLHLFTEPMIVNVNVVKARLDSFILDHCSDGLAVVAINSNWSLLRVKFNSVEESHLLE